MSSVERDAGFCSGADDEDLDDLHSPTDVSEDSVEVKVQPICLRNKNKRKCAEPRKVANDEISLTPHKKRRHFITQTTDDGLIGRFHGDPSTMVEDESVTSFTNSRTVSPFRPWSHHRPPTSLKLDRLPSSTQVSPPPPQYTDRVPELPELPNQEEPLSLVFKNDRDETRRKSGPDRDECRDSSESTPPVKSEFPREQNSVGSEGSNYFARLAMPVHAMMDSRVDHARRLGLTEVREDFKTLQHGSNVIFKREPEHFGASLPRENGSHFKRREELGDSGPSCSYLRPGDRPPTQIRKTLSEMALEDRVICDVEDLSGRPFKTKRPLNDHSGQSTSNCSDKKSSPLAGSQRNYKNMTRERRIEANARERTRVHTISAAFDTLRKTIPAYSHNQKLSKLSVLRIACSYILTLSRVAGNDYSADSSEPSLADCVDMVSRTIQTEGKLRKKKDE